MKKIVLLTIAALFSVNQAYAKENTFKITEQMSTSKFSYKMVINTATLAFGAQLWYVNRHDSRFLAGVLTAVTGAGNLIEDIYNFRSGAGKIMEGEHFKEYRRLKALIQATSTTGVLPASKELVELLVKFDESEKDLQKTASTVFGAMNAIAKVARKDAKRFGEITPANAEEKSLALNNYLSSKVLEEELKDALQGKLNGFTMDFAVKVYMLEYFYWYNIFYKKKVS